MLPARGAVAAQQGGQPRSGVKGHTGCLWLLSAVAAVGSRLRKKSYPVSRVPHIARDHLGLEFRITDYDPNPGIGAERPVALPPDG